MLISAAITIWIHGTKPQHIVPKPLSKLHIERLHKFTHCEPGLHRAQTLDTSLHHYQLAKTLHEQDSVQFPWETLYVFGWSGMLSPSERLKAAQDLQQAIAGLIEEYERIYHQKPSLRLITHSHGGNVALHLAELEDQEHPSFIIDELVLLACPVQKLTAPLIKSKMFKKIYSLHSHLDMVQIADPQGLASIKKVIDKLFMVKSMDQLTDMLRSIEKEPFFSERHFDSSPNLLQIRSKIGARDPLHIEFLLNPFVTKLPKILKFLHTLNPAEVNYKQEMLLDITSSPLGFSC